MYAGRDGDGPLHACSADELIELDLLLPRFHRNRIRRADQCAQCATDAVERPRQPGQTPAHRQALGWTGQGAPAAARAARGIHHRQLHETPVRLHHPILAPLAHGSATGNSFDTSSVIVSSGAGGNSAYVAPRSHASPASAGLSVSLTAMVAVPGNDACTCSTSASSFSRSRPSSSTNTLGGDDCSTLRQAASWLVSRRKNRFACASSRSRSAKTPSIP